MTKPNSAAHLFRPLNIKTITLRNRIGVSPMCQYSSDDGVANEWHLVHLGSRALGGAGLVIAEATAVSPEGRITPGDAGIWAEKHIEPIARINRFLKQHGAVPGIQIAHAGRKASASRPWEGGEHLTDARGGWTTLAPSALPFGDSLTRIPHALTEAEILKVQQDFVAAAKRALTAGVEWLELHFAHGYLAHEFLSPISIIARTNTAAVLITASGLLWRPRAPSAPSGRKIFLLPPAFPPLTGLTMVGILRKVSSSRGG
jgi:2,4-dienoyl-CoA reductase-like NADH-dependent reductase (Old Yellow Enzyme family)